MTELATPNAELTEVRVSIAALRHELEELHSDYRDLNSKFDALVASHNQVGENLQWLVANVQGIFQVFNNPQMMSQLMGQVMGGGAENGGRNR